MQRPGNALPSSKSAPVVPDSVKKEVRSVLLSKVGGVVLSKFPDDYRKLVGHRLEWRKLGFPTLSALLTVIPDVARMDTSPKDQKTHVYGVSEKGMFMNTTAKKAEYKQKGAHAQRHSNSTLTAEEQREKIEKYEEELQPNMKGLYALCIPKRPGITRDIIMDLFSKFGRIVEISISGGKFAFVRYNEKQACIAALLELGDAYDVRIAFERHNPKRLIKSPTDPVPAPEVPSSPSTSGESQVSSDSTYTVFLGNLPIGLSDIQVRALVRGFDKVLNVRTKSDVAKNKKFAFIDFPDKSSGEKLVKGLHLTKLEGRTLVAQQALDKNPRSTPTSTTSSTRADDAAFLESMVLGEVTRVQEDRERTYSESSCSSDLSWQGSASDPSPVLYPKPAADNGVDESRQEPYDSGHFDLWAANFPYGTEWPELLQLFKPYGATRVVMKNNRPDPENGLKTLCYVWFPNFKCADKALGELSSSWFKGRLLTLGIPQYNRPKQDQYKAIKCTVTPQSGGKRQVFVEEDPVGAPLRARSNATKPKFEINEKLLTEFADQGGITTSTPGQKVVVTLSGGHRTSEIEAAVQPHNMELEMTPGRPSLYNQNQAQHKRTHRNSQSEQQQDDEDSVSVREALFGQPVQLEEDKVPCEAMPLVSDTRGQSVQLEEDGIPCEAMALLSDTRGQPVQPKKDEVPCEAMALLSGTTNMFARASPTNSRSSRDEFPPELFINDLARMCEECCPSCSLLDVEDIPASLRVLATHPLSDGRHLWVNLWYESLRHTLEEFKLLSTALTTEPNEVLLPFNKAEKRVAALYQGVWYRGWLTDLGATEATVFFIDFGNIETVQRSSLRSLPVYFWTVHPLAVPAYLMNGVATDLSSNTPKWVQLDKNLTAGYPLRLWIEEENSN